MWNVEGEGVKVLNLYSGIGGNRKLWEGVEVTAVEYDAKIAAAYQKFFPNDKVIVGDAHAYLLEHYAEFDFIWSSRPCTTHTKMNIANQLSPYKDNTAQIKQGGGIKPRYADMGLYEEILFLKHFFKGKYCVENVIAYYDPLIKPTEFGGHWFWTNFHVRIIKTESRGMGKNDTTRETLTKRKGYDWDDLEGLDRELVLRNCVEPELGLHIFNESKRDIQPELFRSIVEESIQSK
jgi:DNA (cytosine-5)-methyltransferase 1